ncbi:MAG: DUF302 domain-containing protein [Candidatus Uhrbacteria bacterium]|nr:DUF302 domain-containing protein [Patescibacteria group bacterium]MBU1907023.1 DUF302 domain-containing protein [Patescibacteria group bacterium]
MEYAYKKPVDLNFEAAVAHIRDELAKEGFGVLTEIDVKATLKKKLDVDYNDYIILGACNAPFAYQALQAEPDIGLLLPCNVIVYQQADQVYVAAILPTVAMGVIDNPELQAIADQVEEKLKKVIDNL